MSFPSETLQPGADQDMLLAFDCFTNLPIYDSYMQCFPNHQQQESGSMCNPMSTANTGSNAWGWSDQFNPFYQATREVQPQLDSTADSYNTLNEPSNEEQDAKQVVSELERRMDKFEEVVEHRIAKIEEVMEQKFAKIEEATSKLHNQYAVP
jgi:hypothetical protein